MCNPKQKESFLRRHRACYDDPGMPLSKVIVDEGLCACDIQRIDRFFRYWHDREDMEFNTYRVPVVESFRAETNLPIRLINPIMRAYYLEGQFQAVCMMYKMAYIVGHSGECPAVLQDIADSDYAVNHLLPAFQRYAADQQKLAGKDNGLGASLGKATMPDAMIGLRLVRSKGTKPPWHLSSSERL